MDRMNKEADFFPSQDRKRNLHAAYAESSTSSGDNNDTDSLNKKKKKITPIAIDEEDC